MKLKLISLLTLLIPFIAIAQAPVIAPPEVVKEPVINKPIDPSGAEAYKSMRSSEAKPEPSQQAHEGSNHIVIRNAEEAKKTGFLRW